MANKKVMLFSCTRCRPCAQIIDMLKYECQRTGVDLEVFDLDSDLNQFKKWNVRGTPIVVCLDEEGIEYPDRLIGAQTTNSILHYFKKWGIE